MHLTALPLELHAHIFSNLQPYDILQVSQACKALYLASSQRMVWADALHRVCVENTLFEPSFPVASMSVLELQRASMGPHHWIAKSSSKERNSDGVLPHSETRHLVSAMSDLSVADLQSFHNHYLVPGGRYLFSLSRDWLVLWDLGSPYSSGGKPHSIAAVPVKFNGHYHLIHSTPDGMGLRVFLLDNDLGVYPDNAAAAYIYEIYPASTSPQLIQIAYTRLNPNFESFFSLSYDRLIFARGNTLTVWDYKANMWARWGVDGGHVKIVTTKSAVMLIHIDGVSVWKIPPLLPESSLSMTTDPSVISPVFELYYPIENHFYDELHQAPCDWYSGTLQPLYYDVEEDTNWNAPRLKVNRCEVAIDSEISGGTLNLLKSFEVPRTEDYYPSIRTRICQDKNVSLWRDSKTDCYLGTRVSDIYDQQLPSFSTPLFHHPIDMNHVTFCPVTSRVIHYETDEDPLAPSIIILDF